MPDRVGSTVFYFESIGLTNRSDTPCTMYGFPGFEVVDAGGHVVATAGRRCTYAACVRTPLLVTLRPGQIASFALEWRSYPAFPAQSTCPQGVLARITPPGAHDHLVLVTSVRACGVPPVVNVSVIGWGT